MIYVAVPKEITEYKAKAVAGLTFKQCKSLLLGAVIGILLGLFFIPLVGADGLGIIITIVCVPAVALSFTDIDSIPMDIYIKYIILYYKNKQILSYENDIVFYPQKGGYLSAETFVQKLKERYRRWKIKRKQGKILEDGSQKTKSRKKKSSDHYPL